MPKFEIGDMWSVYDRHGIVFVFTTNSTVRSDGELVMGAGIAKEVRTRLPGIARALGMLISGQRFPDEFGFLILDYHGKRIGALQTKTRWKDPSTPALIKNSIDKLNRWARENQDTVLHVNYPGIGHGGLPKEIVRPILEILPDNVYIWSN